MSCSAQRKTLRKYNKESHTSRWWQAKAKAKAKAKADRSNYVG